MNKEEDYRNLAGNITEFTDNTCYYEDWLVIQQYVDDWLDEIDRLNNVINELENVIVNFIERHTEDYLDWKYDEKIYLAESNILQKLFDTYYNKLKKLKEKE